MKDEERIDTIPEGEQDDAERVDDVIKEVVDREYLSSIYSRNTALTDVIKDKIDEEFEDKNFIQKKWLIHKAKQRAEYHLTERIAYYAELDRTVPPNTPASREIKEQQQLLIQARQDLIGFRQEILGNVVKGAVYAGVTLLCGKVMYDMNEKGGPLVGHDDAKKILLGDRMKNLFRPW